MAILHNAQKTPFDKNVRVPSDQIRKALATRTEFHPSSFE
jgi:hypothetical protein